MQPKINPNIIDAIKYVEKSGYECYLVGGSVRDYLLDLEPVDYDLATKASLDELELIFKDYKHKIYKHKGITMSVVFNHTHFEITPYKGDDLTEDLSNRDFTINSIAYHPDKGYIDPFYGIKDLSKRELRCPKDPNEVLSIDPLRILRAIRLSETKELVITSSLKEAIIANAYKLKEVSKERIQAEINPILLSKKPSKYIKEYFEVFVQVFPGLKACYKFDQRNRKWHHLDVFEHTMLVLDSTKNNLVLRLAALFHDIGKPQTFTLDDKGIGHFYGHNIASEKEARRNLLDLKYNGILINRVCKLIYHHDRTLANTEKSLLKFLYIFGTNDLDLYFGLRRADILGQNPELLDRIYEIDEITESIRKILNSNKIITYKNLNIKGSDLESLGYFGKDIGNTLEKILKLVIEGKLKNNYDKLISYAQKLKYETPE